MDGDERRTEIETDDGRFDMGATFYLLPLHASEWDRTIIGSSRRDCQERIRLDNKILPKWVTVGFYLRVSRVLDTERPKQGQLSHLACPVARPEASRDEQRRGEDLGGSYYTACWEQIHHFWLLPWWGQQMSSGC